MNYGLIETPTLDASDCLVLGIYGKENLPAFLTGFDDQANQLIHRLANKLKEAGDMVWQTDFNGKSLMLLHCGEKKACNIAQFKKRLNEVVAALNKQRVTSATLCLPFVEHMESAQQIELMLLQFESQLYQLSDFKSDKKKTTHLESILFYLPGAKAEAIKKAKAIAAGVTFARTLADLPANICTPTYLGKQAQALAKHHHSLQTKVMGPQEIKDLGMGALLAVAQGSNEEPRFIEVKYNGAGDSVPIVIVGKGITFDSGGLSLKPANMMDEMKYDMAGAASVLGLCKACAELQLPINLIGLIASAENLPSGTAVKPGDIVTSMSGQTIEIINTDAEGRLVLADALTYAEQFNPQFVIDLATLTGAMVIALGHVNTGFMTTDEELASLILNAAKEANDQAWRMPLEDAYQEALESPIADMVNATFDRSAGAITAACFLSRFTKKYRWAHLDIAGTAWISGKKRAATGRPIPLLVQLLNYVANSR